MGWFRYIFIAKSQGERVILIGQDCSCTVFDLQWSSYPVVHYRVARPPGPVGRLPGRQTASRTTTL